MDKVNAVSKVRFASAKPQNVGLHHSQAFRVNLLCMEPGQQAQVRSDSERVYYVITGAAVLVADQETMNLGTGEMAAFAAHAPHSLATADDRRLVCLVIERSS
jgi:mannose-6-phosphate isomerase-like protein (cupin superfamily)